MAAPTQSIPWPWAVAGGARTAWRGRPSSVRAGAAGLVLLAGVVSGWNIGWRHPSYYTNAAVSMGRSWRALFFGAFDSNASITLDKLAGFAVPEALSVRLFGYHTWAVVAPQVVEGMVTVGLLYVIGSRWRGVPTGFLAAGAAVTTPLLLALFGRASEDSLLTMSLTAALLCWQSAVRTGRWPMLVATAAWVGVGFQAKMMQAWLLVPALLVGQLLVTPGPWRSRWLRAGALAGAVLAFSLSWITVIQLVPASQRPWIDGSTDNNGYAMVFGYNGFNRIVPDLIPGAVGDRTTSVQLLARIEPAAPAPPDPSGPTASARASSSHWKLVLPFFLPQIGWWYPAAGVGLVVGLRPLLRRRRPSAGAAPPGPDERAGLGLAVVVAGWAATVGVVMSKIVIPHFDYLAAFVVPVCLLAADGGTWAIAAWRGATPRGRARAAALLAGQLGWALIVLISQGAAPGWVWPAVAVIGLVGSGLLLLNGPPRRRRLGLAGAATAVLLAPGVFLFFLITRSDLLHGDPYAGPFPGQSLPRGSAAQGRATDSSFGIEPPFHGLPAATLTRAQAGVAAWVRARPGAEGPLLATDVWSSAEPYVLHDGLPVLPFAGFSGTVATPTAADLQNLIVTGRLRFALVDRLNPGATAGRATTAGGGQQLRGAGLALRGYVVAHCRMLAPGVYEHTGVHLLDQDLYACDPPGRTG